MKASELIEKLEEQIALNGDREVYVTSGKDDYPDKVRAVVIRKEWSAYISEGSFVIL